MARPTKYKKEYCDKVDEYLEQEIDEEVEVVKQRNEKKGYEIYDHKLKVRLPTYEGFARFIDIPLRTLHEWREGHEEFSHSLGKIKAEQQRRLINAGLSGEYNSTIAKLILSSNHGMAERKDHTSGGEKLNIVISQEVADKYVANNRTSTNSKG